MMDYLFRGMSTHNVKWIEGDLLVSTYSSGRVEYKIHERVPQATCWFVKPKTVSAYIRRMDKHGRKIFEGDILRETLEEGDAEFLVVVWDDEACAYVLQSATSKSVPPFEMHIQESFENIEVIGNRWENPDMISAEVWEVLA